MSDDELVTIATFTDVSAAQYCKSVLREHGIRAFIPEESFAVPLPSAVWKKTRAKVRLQVLPSDEARAADIINQKEDKEPEDFDEDISQADYVDAEDAGMPIREEDEFTAEGEYIPPRMEEEEFRTTPAPFASERFSGIRFFLKIVAIIAMMCIAFYVIKRLTGGAP